jgi:fibronectin-binding autotransporter adhesin
VGGDLALAGTLDVSDQGGFGIGVYRLFDYTGTRSGNGLVIGDTPAGVNAGDLWIQTAVDHEVNLILSAGAPENGRETVYSH